MSAKKELEQKVVNAIEQIKPYLEADGGSIQFIELTDDNVVNVELLGACASCPMSIMTLKNGVEAAIKQAIPEIKSVDSLSYLKNVKSRASFPISVFSPTLTSNDLFS